LLLRVLSLLLLQMPQKGGVSAAYFSFDKKEKLLV